MAKNRHKITPIPFFNKLDIFLFTFCLFPVSRAVIVGSEQRDELDTTQLTWRLTKLLRATAAGDSSEPDDDYYR